MLKLFRLFQGDERKPKGVARAGLADGVEVGGDGVTESGVAADGLGFNAEEDGLTARWELQGAGHNGGGDQFLAVGGPGGARCQPQPHAVAFGTNREAGLEQQLAKRVSQMGAWQESDEITCIVPAFEIDPTRRSPGRSRCL